MNFRIHGGQERAERRLKEWCLAAYAPGINTKQDHQTYDSGVEPPTEEELEALLLDADPMAATLY